MLEAENKTLGTLSKKPSKKIVSLFIITTAMVFAIIVAFGQEKSGKAINYASNIVAGEKIALPAKDDWTGELGAVNPDVAPAEIDDAGLDTLTDEVSVSLFANYLSLKQTGGVDTATAQKLVDQTVNFITKPSSTQESALNVYVIADNGKKSMIEYGERLGMLFRSHNLTKNREEIKIIQEALTTGDASKISELDPIIATYKAAAQDMSIMPTPTSFVKAHTDIMNGLLSVSAALEELKLVFSDPFLGLASISKYQEESSTILNAINATILYLYQNGIVYKQGSGGYYLYYGI